MQVLLYLSITSVFWEYLPRISSLALTEYCCWCICSVFGMKAYIDLILRGAMQPYPKYIIYCTEEDEQIALYSFYRLCLWVDSNNHYT